MIYVLFSLTEQREIYFVGTILKRILLKLKTFLVYEVKANNYCMAKKVVFKCFLCLEISGVETEPSFESNQ